MLDFYALPGAGRIAAAVLCFLAMLCQVLAAVFAGQRRDVKWLRLAYEVSLIFYFLFSAFLPALAQKNLLDGFWDDGAGFLRWAGLLPVLLGLPLLLGHPRLRNAACLLPLCTLPCWDSLLPAGAWLWLFFPANLLLFLTTLEKLLLHWQGQDAGLSALAAKEALDLLPDGLLFANARGRSLLMNNRMDAILRQCGISPLLRVQAIYSRLAAPEPAAGCRCQPAQDALLLRLQGGGSYLVSLRPFDYKGRSCWQLFAADVTEEDLLTQALDETSRQLEESHRALLAELPQMEALARSRELLRLKTSVHDIIGQRLSIIHRYLEDTGTGRLPPQRLQSLFTSLEADLDRAFAANPAERFDELSRLFSLTGLALHLEGSLPRDPARRSALLQILREAATNALRHGAAHQLTMQLQAGPAGGLLIRLWDDGPGPAGPVREGSGLAGIRSRVQALGGTLAYQAEPGFPICITLPGKRE